MKKPLKKQSAPAMALAKGIESIASLTRLCYMIICDIFKMICINQKRNPKLLETFNNDPYSDITINIGSTNLNLVLGYLSIDS